MTPVAVPNVAGASALSSGDEHLCAASQTGTFSCWGSNTNGQLGSGSAGDKPSAILW